MTTSTVQITSRTPVSSSDEASWRGLPTQYDLSPLDQLVAPFIPVAVVFIYRQPPPGIPRSPILPVDRLSAALTKVLDHYPHLTGRLRLHPDSGLHQLDHLGSGAELLEATCSERLDETPQLLDLPGEGNDLLAPSDMAIEAVCAGPVCSIQHTRFACGGVALGIRILHTINDAGGFFKFVADLAETYRRPDTALRVPPQVEPYLADLSEEDKVKARSFKPTLYHLDDDTAVDGAEANATAAPDVPEVQYDTLAPCTGRVLRLSGADLSKLKQRAASEDGGWVSTFDVLNAHLHQRVYQARHRLRQNLTSNLPPLSPPDLLSPVDVRGKAPGMLKTYTGNAVFTTYAHFDNPADLLSSEPAALGRVAASVHAMTRQKGVTDPQEIESTIKWIAAQGDKSKIKNGFRFGNASLMLSQWNKVDMYDSATFDEGVRPCLVAPPFTPISLLDGLGYYLPTPAQGSEQDKGDIDVYLSLSDDVWGELDVSVQ